MLILPLIIRCPKDVRLSFATDQEVQIMDTMINCFNDHGIAATGHILKCSNEGAKLVE